MITNWTPRHNAKRKGGRQLQRWSDDLKRTTGPLWPKLAGDRETFKKLEEAFVFKHTLDKGLLKTKIKYIYINCKRCTYFRKIQALKLKCIDKFPTESST